MSEKITGIDPTESDPVLRLEAERRLVRSSGSRRHVVFSVKAPASRRGKIRDPLSLSLVIDRSGSMSGSKLETAKAAALMVIEKLGEADRVSVVIFDDEVEVLLPAARVTEARKAEARAKIPGVRARSNTALHEGWLTGCRSITTNDAGAFAGDLSRCFLLTDGIANSGLTDPESIAAQAAEVRKNAGISTSTFGIGDDYNEGLLGPMAVAGSGQFHHLRESGEIASSFLGELSELFNVAARNLRIELELGTIRSAEAVSDYWIRPADGNRRIVVDVGDLIADEERRIVLRLRFPKVAEGEKVLLRARLLRQEGGADHASSWQELAFEGSSQAECDAEIQDPGVMHWVGLHHAERAKKEALDRMRAGDTEAALRKLDGVIERLLKYPLNDVALSRAVAELKSLREDMSRGPLLANVVHETMYMSQMVSRGQRDHRLGR